MSAQQYFADETNEYPLTGENVTPNPALKPLAEIDTPDFDLSDLGGSAGHVGLLQAGAHWRMNINFLSPQNCDNRPSHWYNCWV